MTTNGWNTPSFTESTIFPTGGDDAPNLRAAYNTVITAGGGIIKLGPGLIKMQTSDVIQNGSSPNYSALSLKVAL